MELQGHADAGYERVIDAFVANFEERDEVGAACTVYVGGQPVVDIGGGVADVESGRKWSRDTLQLVFSTTKGATAICAHLLVQQGALDLDAPVAEYWPEFAAEGKANIPVRWVLSHRAGLAEIEGTFTLDEALSWHPVVEALAAQPPNWEPGTEHGYHIRSYGWLVGELVRRIDGRSIGTFFGDEVAQPLGLDFWIGLPEDRERRVSTVIPPPLPTDPAARALYDQFAGPDTSLGRALTGPSGLFHYDDMWNTRAVHAAELPSSNGIGDARSVARMYAATVGVVDGVRLLSPETVATATEVQAEGPDKVIGFPMRYGLGFLLPPALVAGAGPRAFGHAGAGGSLGFADPEHELGFGYVMNKMELGVTNDQRAATLAESVYRCLR